jgi:hypothetical protein
LRIGKAALYVKEILSQHIVLRQEAASEKVSAARRTRFDRLITTEKPALGLLREG